MDTIWYTNWFMKKVWKTKKNLTSLLGLIFNFPRVWSFLYVFLFSTFLKYPCKCKEPQLLRHFDFKFTKWQLWSTTNDSMCSLKSILCFLHYPLQGMNELELSAKTVKIFFFSPENLVSFLVNFVECLSK